MSKKVNLSSPWQTYVNELTAMFEKDDEVQIIFDESDYEVKIYVSKNYKKAEALDKILKHEQDFGNVKLKIDVVPPNEEDDDDILKVFERAFEGNCAMQYTLPVESPIGVFRFVAFENKVVQFYNDQLDDPHGFRSTLFQEIAKDIFDEHLDVRYCTDPIE